MVRVPKEFLKLWSVDTAPYEIVVIAAALLLAWMIERLIMRRIEGKNGWHNVGLRRLAYPICAIAMLGIFQGLFILLGDWPALVLGSALGLSEAKQNALTEWPTALLEVCMQIMLALVLVRGVLFVLRHAFSSQKWLASVEKTLAVVIWLVISLNIFGILPTLIKWLDSFSMQIGTGSSLSVWGVIRGVVLVLATVVTALWIGKELESRLMRAVSIDSSLKVVLARVAKAGLLVLAILMGMSMAGLDVTMLSVFGGALGVGLGFGMQKIASNYVSGFIILLDRSIRIGNIIQMNSPDQRGVVTQITTRYTVVRALSGIHYIVPNETLVTSVVQNETYANTHARLTLKLQVAYSSNVERAITIMEEAANEQPRVLTDPAAAAMLVSFDDSGVSLELGWWIADPENGSGGLRSDIGRTILRRFREEGIEIPFPQREIRILGEQPILPTAFPTV